MSTKKSDSEKDGQESGAAGAAGMPRNWMTSVILLLLREWSSYGYDLMERMADIWVRHDESRFTLSCAASA